MASVSKLVVCQPSSHRPVRFMLDANPRQLLNTMHREQVRLAIDAWSTMFDRNGVTQHDVCALDKFMARHNTRSYHALFSDPTARRQLLAYRADQAALSSSAPGVTRMNAVEWSLVSRPKMETMLFETRAEAVAFVKKTLKQRDNICWWRIQVPGSQMIDKTMHMAHSGRVSSDCLYRCDVTFAQHHTTDARKCINDACDEPPSTAYIGDFCQKHIV
jgi:hypothetical protein